MLARKVLSYRSVFELSYSDGERSLWVKCVSDTGGLWFLMGEGSREVPSGERDGERQGGGR